MLERLAVVIPAFNAADTIASVVRGVKEHIALDRIVVVDDGSSDDTASVARAEGAQVLRHDVNKGKGMSLRTGFEFILKRPEIEAVVTLDADGQHDPREIPEFAEAFRRGGADIIVGSRMRNHSGMPPLRVFTNRVTSAIISLTTGQKIEDSQIGYRLHRASLLRKLELATSRYDTESEILIKGCRLGARVESIPVRTIYADETSAIDPARDAMRFLLLVIRSLFW
jgi:UDP-N-acetylglucosamine---dolichyl-phosphate N-acetylglucosaminyltransferase